MARSPSRRGGPMSTEAALGRLAIRRRAWHIGAVRHCRPRHAIANVRDVRSFPPRSRRRRLAFHCTIFGPAVHYVYREFRPSVGRADRQREGRPLPFTGLLFFSAPLLGLLQPSRADRQRASDFCYAAVRRLLCPLVYGAPTRDVDMHALSGPRCDPAYTRRRTCAALHCSCRLLLWCSRMKAPSFCRHDCCFAVFLRGWRDPTFVRAAQPWPSR